MLQANVKFWIRQGHYEDKHNEFISSNHQVSLLYQNEMPTRFNSTWINIWMRKKRVGLTLYLYNFSVFSFILFNTPVKTNMALVRKESWQTCVVFSRSLSRPDKICADTVLNYHAQTENTHVKLYLQSSANSHA